MTGELQVLVERQRWGEWPNWYPVDTYLAGAVSRRFDSARTLTLTLPNPNGDATDDWQTMDRIRVKAGWGALEPHPVFDGFVPPGRGLAVSAGRLPTLRVAAVDAIGMLDTDGILVDAARAPTLWSTDETSYAGWEVASAVRDIMVTCPWNPALEAIGDWSGFKGTNPLRAIGIDFDEPTGLQSRLKYIQAVVGAAVDDETDPDRPRSYHFWQTARADGDKKLRFDKEADPATAYPVRTIAAGTDLVDAAVEMRTDQRTSAYLRSSKDTATWVRFTPTWTAGRFGRIEQTGSLSTTNTDELLDSARAIVGAKRLPVRSYVVSVRDGFRHELNQVVAVDNPRYGGSGNFLVTGVDVAFSPRDVSTQLRLSAPEELLTDALA